MDQSASSSLSRLENLRLQAELNTLTRARMALQPGVPMFAFKTAQIAAKRVTLWNKLGIDLSGPRREKDAFKTDGPAELPAVPREPSGQFYDYDDDRTHGQRKKFNSAAIALLAEIDAGTVDGSKLTAEQKATLAKYSGTGGNLVGADGKKGSDYEYYTPKPIADGMWSLLGELGFKGGKVLDPCAGTGIFGASAPSNAVIESIELNETSGRVNQLVNGGPSYNAIVSPFEAIASRTEDEIYDAVISNVPFGDKNARGTNRRLDPKYQEETLETYFIMRSLEKLRPGGLAAFIVPPRVVSTKGSGAEEKLRTRASYLAEFMGAYRMPNSVFGTADADTMTDVIVFRKFSRDAITKIDELKSQDTSKLIEANVLWTEFISGHYFTGEGKRNVLGDFVPKDSTKYRDVDRVISDASLPNIAKLLRKFPGSRIDWKLIEATETDPIEYREGDSMTLAGETLELRGGKWIAVGASESNDVYDSLGAVFTTAVDGVNAKASWEQADGYVKYLMSRSKELDLMPWLRAAWRDVNGNAAGDRPGAWLGLSAGLACVEATQAHGSQPQFNYVEQYPVITEALQSSAANARRSLPSYTGGSKAALEKHRLTFNRKTGFSNQWKGDGLAAVTVGTLDEQAQVAALKYTGRTTDIEIAKLKGIFGENFDPHTDDEWCLNADGTKATKADDYYFGNLADFLARLDAEIKAAPEGAVRAKLLRQREIAATRVDAVDPANLKFNLFSPFVEIEEKAEFLRRFMHPAFAVAYDDDGKKILVCDAGKSVSDTVGEAERKRQLKRFAGYLNSGNISTRTTDAEIKADGQIDAMRRKMLRDMAMQANAQFDTWTKANPSIMERMRAKANDPTRLYFTEIDDNSPIEIPGMTKALNPKTGKPFALHGFQNAFVRKQGRAFGGINGFDVGLGKTFTALACAQYVHSIGVKKKTFFVVPNSVLSNWRKEAGIAYESTDDCLFIGLDINTKTGKASVDPANYARDFTRVLENRHRKIFCTTQAFKSIPLRDETLADYDAYLMSVDPSYQETEKKGESERAASKRSEATASTGAKSSAIPYFEDMGVDSIVIDEAHQFKNSKNTVEFSGAKFLSVAAASDQGADMQIKAWYIRGLTPNGDGVLPLTATPITNSPLEIYAMLTLAVGEKRVHDLTMGAAGADAFMNAMCAIEDDEDVTIDGRTKPYRVFRGLQNVDMLRSALANIATIKTGADVKLAGDDLKLPDANDNKTPVALSKPTLIKLNEYKMAYRAAKEITGTAGKDAAPCTEEEIAAFDRVQARFGERPELIAHPFNLISKMTDLIADPELDDRATYFDFDAAQATQAAAAVAAFNKLGKIEVRNAAGTFTETADIVGQKVKKQGDNESIQLRIKVQAYVVKGRIAIDTLDPQLQAEFEKQADKAGLSLDVSVPPKLAAMLENVLAEEAKPRNPTSRVKQIIFCDILAMHSKIKMILTKRAGIPAGAIAIVTGKSIKDAEQMQDIQDGFNAEADNRYRYIIANKKAEVGVNYQKGTQAVHHLTIGWTPDSQHQRNGRAVRQGNEVDYVNLYFYDADGTFDEYKRTLTTKKADWIAAVMDKQGGNEIAVSGRLSAEQYDEMIESMGDATKIAAIQERAELREKLQRADTARQKQLINLETAIAQNGFAKQYTKAEKWVGDRVLALYDLSVSIEAMQKRSQITMSGGALIKMQSRIADAEAQLSSMRRTIDESASFDDNGHVRSLDQLLARAAGKTGASARSAIEKTLWAVGAREGSVLYGEWEENVQTATAMTNESLKEFERLAKSADGSLPGQFAQAFREGNMAMIDKKPFARGMFLRERNKLGETGDLWVVANGILAVRFPHSQKKVADAVAAKWDVIGFDSPEYDACLTEAAGDDDMAAKVEPETKKRLFSSIVPAVGARMKTEIVVHYRANDVILPSPYFPYVINPKLPLSAPVLALAAAQSAIVKEWDTYTVGIDSRADIVVTTYANATKAEDRTKALAGYAKAGGTPLTIRDYGIVTNGSDSYLTGVSYQLRELGAWQGEGVIGQVLAACNTVEEVADAKLRFVEAAMGEILVIDASVELTSLLPYPVAGAINRRLSEINRAKQLAEMAANPTPAPAPVAETIAPAAAPGDTGGITPNAKGLIGIKGQTRPHKELIKAISKEVGGYARWNGSMEQWDVPAAMWSKLCTDRPDVAKVLFVVPA